MVSIGLEMHEFMVPGLEERRVVVSADNTGPPFLVAHSSELRHNASLSSLFIRTRCPSTLPCRLAWDSKHSPRAFFTPLSAIYVADSSCWVDTLSLSLTLLVSAWRSVAHFPRETRLADSSGFCSISPVTQDRTLEWEGRSVTIISLSRR